MNRDEHENSTFSNPEAHDFCSAGFCSGRGDKAFVLGSVQGGVVGLLFWVEGLVVGLSSLTLTWSFMFFIEKAPSQKID